MSPRARLLAASVALACAGAGACGRNRGAADAEPVPAAASAEADAAGPADTLDPRIPSLLGVDDEVLAAAIALHLEEAAVAFGAAPRAAVDPARAYLLAHVRVRDDPAATERLVDLLLQLLERQMNDPNPLALSVEDGLRAARVAHQHPPQADPMLVADMRRFIPRDATVEIDGHPSEIDAGAREAWRRRPRRGVVADEALAAALAALRAASPGLGDYQAKVRLVRVLREVHGLAGDGVGFAPLAGLAPPDGLPACPAPSPAYQPRHPALYPDDPIVQSLWRTSDDRLPDAALPTLVALLAVDAGLTPLERAGAAKSPAAAGGREPRPAAQALLVRYGDRALPCLFAALAGPATFARGAGGREPLLHEGARGVAARIPGGARLYRAAIEAGWHDWLVTAVGTPNLDALADLYPAADWPYRRRR